MILKALQTELFSIKIDSLGKKIPKSPEFNLYTYNEVWCTRILTKKKVIFRDGNIKCLLKDWKNLQNCNSNKIFIPRIVFYEQMNEQVELFDHIQMIQMIALRGQI